MYEIVTDEETFMAEAIQHITVKNGEYVPVIYVESDGFRAFLPFDEEEGVQEVRVFALPDHTLLGFEPTGTFEFFPDPDPREQALEIVAQLEKIL